MITPETATADTLKLWQGLPPFVQEQDAANGYTFLTWLSGAGDQLQTIDTLCRDDGDVPGWSIIMDASRCPTYALPWLGQFVGTRFAPGTTDTQMRAQLLNPPGWNRGTVGAITQAAAPFLLTGYSIAILERVPDAYSITINVPSSGVIGYTYAAIDADYTPYSVLDGTFATYGAFSTNTAAIEAAILAALPAGIVGHINFI